MELGHPPLSFDQSPKELVEREREKKKNYIHFWKTKTFHEILLYKTLDWHCMNYSLKAIARR